MSINIFENSKASKKFYKIFEDLNGKKAKESFSKSVRELFDKKVTSPEGEFGSFKISESDLEMLKPCWNCGRVDCVCDEEYQNYKESQDNQKLSWN